MTRLRETDIDLDPDHHVTQRGTSLRVQRRNATFEQAHKLLQADPDGDERSQFQWFRLPNGELILGFYPQGQAYHDASLAIDI